MSKLGVFCSQLGIERRLDRRDTKLPCSPTSPTRCSHWSPILDGEQLTFPELWPVHKRERITARHVKHMLARDFLIPASAEKRPSRVILSEIPPAPAPWRDDITLIGRNALKSKLCWLELAH